MEKKIIYRKNYFTSMVSHRLFFTCIGTSLQLLYLIGTIVRANTPKKLVRCTDPVIAGTVFRYSHGFYLFPVLTQILPFFCTPTDSTLFRYLRGQFFDTRTDPTFSWYSFGFYHFSVLTHIRPFSGTPWDRVICGSAPNPYWVLKNFLNSFIFNTNLSH